MTTARALAAALLLTLALLPPAVAAPLGCVATEEACAFACPALAILVVHVQRVAPGGTWLIVGAATCGEATAWCVSEGGDECAAWTLSVQPSESEGQCLNPMHWYVRVTCTAAPLLEVA